MEFRHAVRSFPSQGIRIARDRTLASMMTRRTKSMR
jgi:hypothetical protein